MFPYLPEGHVKGQELPSKNLPEGHKKQLVFDAPEHVSHSEWHESHVKVDVFANLPWGHTERHDVPSR